MNIVKRRTNIKLVVNNSIERHPVPVLGVDYRVKIIYKNIKITELDVEGKTIKISLPNKYKKMSNITILDLAIEKMYEQIANVELERAMEKTRIMLGFAPEEYEVKKCQGLGKCENNKITINPEVVKYKRNIDRILGYQFEGDQVTVTFLSTIQVEKKYKDALTGEKQTSSQSFSTSSDEIVLQKIDGNWKIVYTNLQYNEYGNSAVDSDSLVMY